MRTRILKIILMILLGLSVVSCELFSPKFWREVDRENVENDVRCYRKSNGNMYCKDKNGNIVY